MSLKKNLIDTVRINQSDVSFTSNRRTGDRTAVETYLSPTPTCSTRYGNRAGRAITQGEFLLALEAVGVDVMDDGRHGDRGEGIVPLY